MVCEDVSLLVLAFIKIGSFIWTGFVRLRFVIVSVIESFSYSVRNMAHDKATSLPVFLEIGAFGLICDGFMSFWRLELHLKDGES
jgi:hypothetical protein